MWEAFWGTILHGAVGGVIGYLLAIVHNMQDRIDKQEAKIVGLRFELDGLHKKMKSFSEAEQRQTTFKTEKP